MKKLLYLAWMLLALPLMAQVSNPSIIPVVSAPSGACSQVLPDQQTTVAGIVYTCQNGTWASIGSGGGGSLPTSNAIGDTLYATAASSTTYTARTNSKIPVELYGVTAYTSEALAEAGPDDTANFQSAVTAAVGGVATCTAGKWYHVDGPVNFISYTGLVGTSNQTYSGHCNLISNSASTKILPVVGVSGTPVTGVTLANLTIIRSVIGTGTSAGIYASFTGAMIVTNTVSENSIYDYYRHASPGFGIGYWSYNQASWSVGLASSGTYYGFYDDSADGNAENSIILTHSSVSCSNLSGAAVGYGQILTGEAVNDNDTWDFNTANCQYGQVVNYTGSGGTIATNDIHFYGSTLDGVKISCLKISNTSLATDGYVEVNGGHCDTVNSTGSLIDIESSYGVKIAGMSISQTTAGTPALHFIYANGSTNLVLANNTLTNFSSSSGEAVEFNGTTHSTLTGNSIYASTGNVGNIVWLTGNSTFNAVTGNNISGFSSAGYGIGIDAGSNNNNCCATNAIDATNLSLGTVGDAGTSNGFTPGSQPLNVTANSAAAHVNIANYLAPNATVGATCLAYETFGQAATANNEVQRVFGCLGAGSANNFYGWRMVGATPFAAAILPNGSLVVGETAPAAGPTNGLAVQALVQQINVYSAAGTALPTCNTAAKGTYAQVSDATSPTYLGTYTSGGAVFAPVVCNGTNWVTH